jgi:NADH dehydrogenase [ubiquinone] 1 alpha subcomplex assembly factor 1
MLNKKMTSVMFWVLCVVSMCACTLPVTTQETAVQQDTSMKIVDFALPNETKPWFPLNDDVMGGVSRSEIVATTSGTAIFRGVVSFENNGGFATVQTNFAQPVNLSTFRGLTLRIKGDTKRYGMYLRTNSRSLVYQATFATSGEWQMVQLPFDQFKPTYFGRTVPGDPVDASIIRSMSVLIEYKQEGPFALEIAHIGVY